MLRIAALLIPLSAFLSSAAAEPKAPKVPVVATPVERIKIAKDFKIELLYSVPKDTQGSWVCLCVDAKGRLIASDQYGSLYRITPPELNGKSDDTRVEKIPAPIGEAQGLLWAFDSLYVCVNKGGKDKTTGNSYSGLYRVTSSKHDDTLDKVECLRNLDGGGGEHGPHALLLSADGKSIYVVCGDQTHMPALDSTRVPPRWSEDHLLPRMSDGQGFMAGVLGPGGSIYQVDPDGKNWKLHATGFRNEYDAAFNHFGDLFTYDADMEWDFNTPWYRPTRICVAVSGAEFGWRNGTGKWPVHYMDSVPPVLNIGPGSPTGVCFGYGAKFPAKYQEALYGCDWSYGKLYAIHITPDGAGYKAEKEDFLSASPLPLTDIVINPKDQAMYFTIGGRKTQSALYRVTYAGAESTEPAKANDAFATERDLRHQLEIYHEKTDAGAVKFIWPNLSHKDRLIRYAARVALEHQPLAEWKELALNETEPQAAMEALIALIRETALDQFHTRPGGPAPEPERRGRIMAALERIDWDKLSDDQRLELLRAYGLAFIRLGEPAMPEVKTAIEKFESHYPANRTELPLRTASKDGTEQDLRSTRTLELNAMLCEMLIYLQSPDAATKTLALLDKAPSQEEQLEYAKSLRMLKAGWTMEQRKQYMAWFIKAANYKGGASFAKFVSNIKKEAVEALPADAKADKSLMEIVNTVPPVKSPQEIFGAVLAGRTTIKEWTVDELVPKTEKALASGRDFERGRQMFGAAGCVACHRFNNEGGAFGPDLTGAGGRFNPRDLLESIILPSKEVSDQYQQVLIVTADGKRVLGRIINLHGDSYSVCENMYDPGKLTNINATQIKSITPSKISPMPEGLLGRLKEEEIMDLLAYLISRGDSGNGMFRK
ncbi:MAG TPA: c-type cytochrome [Planctomycetota bacterium]|nr:c-type cytochrome [Planctomycetota bacterium]